MLYKFIFIVFGLLFLTGCNYYDDNYDNMRTIPITNNPSVVPNSGSVLPGMPIDS